MIKFLKESPPSCVKVDSDAVYGVYTKYRLQTFIAATLLSFLLPVFTWKEKPAID